MSIATHLLYVPIDQLHDNSDNPRTDLGDLTELSASLESMGVLQPLLVTPNGDGYTVIAGHRRLAALRGLGVDEPVPCLVRELDGADVVTAALIENLMRQDLDPLEEARGFQLLTTHGMSQRQIAERVGCNQSHVSRRLQLAKLPEVATKMMTDGAMTIRQAEQLADVDEADIAEVATLVDERRRDGEELRDWEIDEAVNRLAKRRKHDAALAKGEASGLKRLKQQPWSGAGDHRPCKRTEATHWYLGEHDVGIIWARTAKADAKAKAAAGETTSTGPSEWEIRRQRTDAAAEQREVILRRLLDEDLDLARDAGLAMLVDALTASAYLNFDIGALATLLDDEARIADLTDDHATFVAVVVLADALRVDPEPQPYECEFGQPARDTWQRLLQLVGELQPEAPDVAPDVVDVSGPDEWQEVPADGPPAVVEEFATVDAGPLDDAHGVMVAADELEIVEEDADVGEPEPEADPAWLTKKPWATYDANSPARRITIVRQLNSADRVRHVAAYERAHDGDGEVLVACGERLTELAGGAS